MGDFRSLLATFQEATGTAQPPAIQKPQSARYGTNERTNQSAISETQSNIDPTFLKQHIGRLWGMSNIRKVMQGNAEKEKSAISFSSLSNGISGNLDGASIVDIHIVVCAVIVDNFPHEDIWRKWMDSGETTSSSSNSPVNQSSSAGNGKNTKINNEQTNKCDNVKIRATAEMFIHAKSPEKIKSDWVKSKTLSHTYRPNWNDVRVVRAMIALMKEAIESKNEQQPKVTHILFCTESCIPITSLHDAAKRLAITNHCSNDNGGFTIDINRSFVDAYDKNSFKLTKFDEQSCWNMLRKYVPEDAIWKALPGWCILSRKHAISVLNLSCQQTDEKDGNEQTRGKNADGNDSNVELWPAFSEVWAPEEVYFPTILALAGHLPGPEVISESLMFAKWDERAKNHSDRAHPLVYDGQLSRQLLDSINIDEEGKTIPDRFLFMRKFKQSMSVDLWSSVVLCKESCSNHKSSSAHTGNNYNRDMGRYSDHYQNHYNNYNSNNKRRKRDEENDSDSYYGNSGNRRRYDGKDNSSYSRRNWH